MEYILHIEKSDDIVSIRSRINLLLANDGQVEAWRATRRKRRLLLVVPSQNQALHSLVNVKLLRRLVETKLTTLGIVSDHPTVRDYAAEVGFKVFSSVRGAKRFGWISDKAQVALPDQTLPPVFNPQDAAAGEASPQAKKRARKKRYRVVTAEGQSTFVKQAAGVVLSLLTALLFVVGLVLILPSATVSLTPLAQPLTTNLVVRGDPEANRIDYRTLTFPARVAQVDLNMSGEIPTTESEYAPTGLAQGSVTMINRTEEPQTIPEGTVLLTSSGEQVEFTTVITAEVPPGVDVTLTVPIVASEPGPVGNVNAGTITRFANPVYGVAVRVINEFGTGGGILELARVVVNDDKERLQTYLMEELQREGLRQLEETLSAQEFISPDTIQVIPLAVTYREFAGDFSETFGGEMQAVVRGTVVGGYNANRLALAGLEAQVPPGYELATEGLHFGAGEVLEVNNGVVVFRIVASGLAVPELDPYQISQQIAWLPVGEAQAFLSRVYPLATVPGVELEPAWLSDWLGRLPYSPVRVNVVIDDAVTLLSDDS